MDEGQGRAEIVGTSSWSSSRRLGPAAIRGNPAKTRDGDAQSSDRQTLPELFRRSSFSGSFPSGLRGYVCPKTTGASSLLSADVRIVVATPVLQCEVCSNSTRIHVITAKLHVITF